MLRKVFKIYRKIMRGIINKKNRMRLKNKDMTILATNCNGTFIYHDLKLRFNSPTINLYIDALDFLKFIERMDYYLKCEMVEVESDKDFPVGQIDDIKIYFMHYKSFHEAKRKWNERKKRINKGNLFIISGDFGYNNNMEMFQRFDKLPYENKVIFTHKPYPNIKSSYYIKGFENKNELTKLFDIENKILQKRYLDQFDYVSWFNTREFPYNKKYNVKN